jgi:acyl dehydratase
MPRTPPEPIKQSLYYDDFHLGQTFVTKARTITEADVVNFAALSWDHNRLHTDAQYASRSPYGKRIAHGLLGTVAHTGLAYQLTEESLIALLEMTWQFKQPIFIGDTIRVEQRVKEMRPAGAGDKGILTFEKNVLNQKGDIVQTGTTTILLKNKERTE